MAYKTPAYREVAIQILDNVVQRLLVKATWQYIEKYWKARPTFPDPVVYENIMYSGHLSQVIALYESISGDMKYSDRGFDFVWNATNVMHYNLYQLNTVIYKQMVDEKNGGGVSCEPNWVYIICQACSQSLSITYFVEPSTYWFCIARRNSWYQF